MGLPSSLMRSAVKNAKQNAYGSRVKKKLCTSIIKKDGIQIQPRVDEGTKKCRKCERFKQTGVQNHKGHDPTCSKNRKHGKLTSKETIRVNKQANIYLKSNQQKLKPAEKGGSNPLAATDVQAFLEPDYCQTVNNASSAPPPSPSSKPSSTSPKKKAANNDDTKKKKEEKFPPLSDELLSWETIKNEVNDRVDNPTATMKMATNIPIQVAAVFDYLLTIFPGSFNRIDNKAMAGNRSKAKRQLEFYRKHSPCNTISTFYETSIR